MIPCLTFLFTSAPAPASGYVDDQSFSVPFGGFHVTEEDPTQNILIRAGCDCTVDITNNGPGDIIIKLYKLGSKDPKTYELGSNKSLACRVKKGGGMAVELVSKESHATGTYTL
jgi:hypothetical protein